MPKPIIFLATALRQFAELFQPCFSKPQFKYFVTVLLVAQVVQTQNQLEAEVKPGPGRPPKTDKLKTLVTGFLIFDDSTHHKPKG